MNDLTVVIKTSERPECLRRLLLSLRRYYPSIPVIVVDDSRTPLPSHEFDANVLYVHTEFDIGVSEGRNRGVALARTEMVAILDDDMVFVDRTRLDLLRSALRLGHFDVVGGRVIECGSKRRRREFCGIYELVGDCLVRHVGETRGTRSGRPVYDFCSNVFVARADFLRENQWTPELKLREHWEFFYRIFRKRTGSVTVLQEVSVEHHSIMPRNYEYYRRRSKDYLSVGLAKHGLRDIKSPAASSVARVVPAG